MGSVPSLSTSSARLFAIRTTKNLNTPSKKMARLSNISAPTCTTTCLPCSKCSLGIRAIEFSSYFALTILATLLVRYPRDLNLEYQQVLGEGNKKPSGVNHEKSVDYHPTVLHAECETLAQGIKSRPFVFLLPMVLTSTLFGMLMANSYKVYGLSVSVALSLDQTEG